MNGDNRYVAMLNSDSSRRILDNNWFDNEWNSDNRFLFVRKSFHVLQTAFIPSVRAVSFGENFANYLYLFQFHLVDLRVLNISYDPNILLPMQFVKRI